MNTPILFITAACFIAGSLVYALYKYTARRNLQKLQAKAQQADPDALVALGRKYYEGNGLPKKREKAFSLFKPAD